VTWEVVFFRDHRGHTPALEFLERIPENPRAKTFKWLELLEEEGPNLPRPYADVLDGKIRELRVSQGHLEVRLLYFFVREKIIVSHGFLKKTHTVPRKEIDRAIRNMGEYFNREEIK